MGVFRRYLFALLAVLLLNGSAVQASIFNNSGSDSEDSISISMAILDTLGSAELATTSDSLFITVNYPNGTLAFRDSMLLSDSRCAIPGYDNIVFTDQVSDIDGDGIDGVYSWTVTVLDASLSLRTSKSGFFQVYSTSDLTDKLDSLAYDHDVSNIDGWNPITDNDSLIIDQSTRVAVGDTNSDPFDNVDDGVTFANDTLETIATNIDSLIARLEYVRDSLQYLVTGSGSDSASMIRFVNHAVWGLRSEDSSTVSDRWVNLSELNDLSAADVWDLTTDGHTGAGTFGLMLESCSTGVAGIKAVTDKLTFDGDDSLIVSGDGISLAGLSTHSAADVWSVGTRTLTEFDEDNMTIDLNATPTGLNWGYITNQDQSVNLTNTLVQTVGTAYVLANAGLADTLEDLLIDTWSVARDATKDDYKGLTQNQARQLEALASAAKVEDRQIRYISTNGNNANGLTWDSAWTGFDSLKTLDAATTVFVGPGYYSDVACSLKTSGIHLIGIAGAGSTFLTQSDTAYTNRIIAINPDGDYATDFRVTGFTFAHAIPDEPGDPTYICAIAMHDSTDYVEIDHCHFADDLRGTGTASDSVYSNWKSISVKHAVTTGLECNRYYNIHHNIFEGFIHHIDLIAQHSAIHHNEFHGLHVKNGYNEVNIPIQFIGKSHHNLVYENYFLPRMHNAVIMNDGGGSHRVDSSLVANNFVGVTASSDYRVDGDGLDNSFIDNHGHAPWAYRLPTVAGDNAVTDIGNAEEREYDRWAMIMMEPTNMVPNGGLQLWGSDTTDILGWGNKSGCWLTRRNTFGDYAWSLQLPAGSWIATLRMYMEPGIYEVSAWIYLRNSADDRISIQCYNAAGQVQTWSDGQTAAYAEKYSGWRRFSETINIPDDSNYAFTLNAAANDSGYVVGFEVRPYLADIFAVDGDTAKAVELKEVIDTVFASKSILNDVSDSLAGQAWAATASSQGTGGSPLHVLVLDTKDSSAVAHATVTVDTRYDGSGSEYWDETDGNGYAVLNMSEGDSCLIVATAAPPYSFTQDSILKGADLEYDTLWATGWVCGNPPTASICSVYTWTKYPDADSASGVRVSASLVTSNNRIFENGNLYLQRIVTTKASQSGYWSIGLVPNPLIDSLSSSSDSSYYQFDIEYGGEVRESYKAQVPDSSTVNFISLIRNFRR